MLLMLRFHDNNEGVTRWWCKGATTPFPRVLDRAPVQCSSLLWLCLGFISY